MTERWLAVVGLEGQYSISDEGRVRSEARHVVGRHGTRRCPERILKAQAVKSGHLIADLGKQRRAARVHRLVLEAFVGPCPEGMEACHNDGNPANNRLENLRWDTRRNNILDAIRHGTHPTASKTRCLRNHDFTAENTYIGRNGGRNCRACTRERAARRYVPHPSSPQIACRKAGHDWTNPYNVYTRPNGRRYCAECTRIAVRDKRSVA